MADVTYKRKGLSWPKLALCSLAAVLALGYVIKVNRHTPTVEARELQVYCAAGVRLPVEAAAKQYEAEYGVKIRLDYDSSGGLESKLKLDRDNGKIRADVYIPADISFANRAAENGLTAEIIPLAKFQLVVGIDPSVEVEVTSIDDLIDGKLVYGICEPVAGAGKLTKKVVEQLGKYEQLTKNKKVSFTRVTEVANAVAVTKGLDAGIIWDTTARQFKLKMVVIPEFEQAQSSIVGSVVAGSSNPTDALRFIRYLAAPEKGRALFEENLFTVPDTPGDAWAVVPKITVYCGGVNRNAVEATMREFEKREGCEILEEFAGCGKLVAGIRATAGDDFKKGFPDAFMTCDASYMAKVQELFDMPVDVSSTHIVMLVRKGNPKGIRTLKDLAQPGLAIGTTDPKVSTLGDLSHQLLRDAGVMNAIELQKSIAVTTPTAHELILQMEGHGKLDVALVYEANCNELLDTFDLVPVDHPLATAVQNIAVARKSRYPDLSARLMKQILSVQSRERFESNGFTWQATP
ncbi:MAG: molybdate transport system substrate-binding protein [Kiritimatiellia bacterium]|jgi:molybdate transport system substrate-binding protein